MKARAQRAHVTADRGKVERVMVRPTPEGVAAMFMALTVRDVSAADMARFADGLTAMKHEALGSLGAA